MNHSHQFFSRSIRSVVCAMALTFVGTPRSFAMPISFGDVFVSMQNSDVQHYDSSLTLLETLHTLSPINGASAGMAFDCFGNLYVTGFNDRNVYEFRQSDGSLMGVFASGSSGSIPPDFSLWFQPESIVFDASNNAYIGNVGGGGGSFSYGIHKFNASGVLLDTFLPGDRVDWMDLSADQKTLLFTEEGQFGGIKIKRVDLSTDTPLPDFIVGSGLYSVRILPNGDVLSSDRTDIKRFNSLGVLQQTYSVLGYRNFFDIYPSSDGTSFWAVDLGGDLLNINVASGNVLQSLHISDTVMPLGVAVAGGFVAACSPFNTPCDGTAVPEPSTIVLMGVGFVGLSMMRLYRR